MDAIATDHLASGLRTVVARLQRKLRKLSPANTPLSQTERSVLVLLDQHGQLLSAELAIMEKITPQSMGQITNHLLQLKLINKTISEEDKRKIYISLSKQGLKMLEAVRKERNEWLSNAINKVCTDKEKAVLLQAIVPLSKLVEFN